MFVRQLSALPDALHDFWPVVGEHAAWLDLPGAVRSVLIGDGEAVLEVPYPALTATAYLDYARTGNRVRFEDSYFARRRQLNALVLAECAERRGRFLDRIVDGVMLLCEESGWQLPAHNSHVRGGKRDALPDIGNPVIDLFAAETGAQLAMVATVLGPELDAVTPEIVQRIDRELEQRIFRPYRTRHFWWMGSGDEPMNNWTAWCTQNILLAAFSRPTSQELRRDVVVKAVGSLDAFLKEYGADGACEEGVLYYRHAGLCLFNSMVVLDAVAPGCFTPLWTEPKIRNIAEYVLKVHVEGPHYFNFGDCSALVERCGAREFLFGRAVGSKALVDFAAADWAREKRANLPDEINLFYRVQSAFAARELAAHRPAPVALRDVFLPSIGLLVARDERFALAVKAGDNGDSHNHNDVGSVILYKDGRPVLIDVGVESYTGKTFSAQRYEIWTMQSAYHNLPSFDGVMQRDGEEFAAQDVVASFTPEAAGIVMEIAGAYPAEAGVRSYRRSVRLIKGQGVELVDVSDGDRAAELSLMLSQEPSFEGDRIVLPGLAELTLEGAGVPRVEVIPISDERLRRAWPDRLYRMLVPLAARRLRIIIS